MRFVKAAHAVISRMGRGIRDLVNGPSVRVDDEVLVHRAGAAADVLGGQVVDDVGEDETVDEALLVGR